MKEMKRSMSHMVTENSTTKKGPPSQAEPILGWLWKVVEIYCKYRYLLISEWFGSVNSHWDRCCCSWRTHNAQVRRVCLIMYLSVGKFKFIPLAPTYEEWIFWSELGVWLWLYLKFCRNGELQSAQMTNTYQAMWLPYDNRRASEKIGKYPSGWEIHDMWLDTIFRTSLWLQIWDMFQGEMVAEYW